MGERAINTDAASGTGPTHGHDPHKDKLAACPSGPPQPFVRERRAENCCLMTGQENERGVPYLLLGGEQNEI